MITKTPTGRPVVRRKPGKDAPRTTRQWATLAGTLLVAALPGRSQARQARPADQPATAPPAQLSTPPSGAPKQPQPSKVPPENGGAELLLFEDVPVVVTSSRSAQPITLSSIPVSILTHQEIHSSGLISFPEMLKFLPDVDALILDRNRTALGVRGLHFEFSDRTLFLIDGRNATDPTYGGVDFAPLPLFPEDVERLEVARGPGGAAWGANAFNGVINVITKSPADTQGLLLSTTINQFGDSFTHARVGAKADDLAFRVSLGYESHESSEKAVGDGTFTSNDFGRTYLLDTSAQYTFSAASRLKFGVANSENTHGAFEFGGFRSPDNTTTSLTRVFATLERDLDAGQFYLRWFGNFQNTDQAQFWNYSSAQDDLEAQLATKVGSDHELTVGGNVRSDLVDFEDAPPGTLLGGVSESAWWAGAFVIDRWSATDRLTVESQLRADYYTETGPDWSARLTGLLALDTPKHHIVRVSAAKAFRAPLAGTRLVDGEAGPTQIPDIYGVNFFRAEDLKNEEVYSLEAGYSGRLSEYATVRLDGYYSRYRDLIGFAEFNDPLDLGRTIVQFQNLGGADGAGFEAELALGQKSWSVSPWYSLNHLSTDQPDQSIRAWFPAEHKAGIRTRVDLTDALTLTANYRYTGTTQGTQNNMPYGASNLFDASLGYRVTKNFEALVGVSDLFDSTTDPVLQAGSLTGTPAVGRTFFFRLQLNF